ncbi:MAG: lipid-A-disaccharide synthase [Candidatus Saganbacteria bacterium]|uniref:Lipid-A-disaccharide synthase n=1 Tax=Candidatus Saganbacteria bacterium TaxID=2575572 RepID=A0A833NWW9_UNCSA|nr:MAG: lipid-A-disaccharide synthase [Candidatus Saganbacteria bacterium]
MKIMLSAGETSGDTYGAHLVKYLKDLRPDIYFFGMGGNRMFSAGVDIKFDISSKGTVGIFEALPNALSIFSVLSKMKALLLKESPDLLILIDSQGLNMPLAKYANAIGIKTCYFIAPQEWLWGSSKNTKIVAETLDYIIAIFEKEYSIYKSFGANVFYFGHPLLDMIKINSTREQILSKLGANISEPIIMLCPGSRIQEINSVFPVLLSACEIFSQKYPNSFFPVAAASAWIKPYIISRLKKSSLKNFQVFENLTHEIISVSDLVLASSGTINLEASIIGTPNIMAYKLNPLTFFIAKNILKLGNKLKYFSMPNILLGKRLVPELIQENATAANIFNCLNDSYVNKVSFDNKSLLAKLGSPPVFPNIAKKILSFTSSPCTPHLSAGRRGPKGDPRTKATFAG